MLLGGTSGESHDERNTYDRWAEFFYESCYRVLQTQSETRKRCPPRRSRRWKTKPTRLQMRTRGVATARTLRRPRALTVKNARRLCGGKRRRAPCDKPRMNLPKKLSPYQPRSTCCRSRCTKPRICPRRMRKVVRIRSRWCGADELKRKPMCAMPPPPRGGSRRCSCKSSCR